MRLPQNTLQFLRTLGERSQWARRWAAMRAWRPAWIVERRIRRMQASIALHQEALLHFGHESDEEFTALAVELSRLNAKFGELREQSTALDLVVQGKDDERASASAYQLYKSSIDLVHSSMGIALSEQEQMLQVETSLRNAYTVHSHFEHNNVTLHILMMGLRMEAARVDPENQGVFLTVADSVQAAADKIEETVGPAFARIQTVLHETASERSQLKLLERTLHDRANANIAAIHRELDALNASLEPCHEENLQISTLLDQTTPTTLRIISALQHQDIVRQKLEHVATGFADITAHMANGHGHTGPGHRRRNRMDQGYLHHAARVQQTHLVAARGEIETAGEKVTSSLHALLQLGDGLLRQFSRMEEVAEKAFGNFRVAAMFASEVEALAQIADQGRQTNQKVTALVARIAEIAEVFALKLSTHEYDVRLVALNAQIAACRMPDAEALNKLAEEINRVAADNAAVTDRLTSELRTTLRHLEGIKHEADEFLRIVTTERSALAANAQLVTEKLNRLSQTVRQSAARINQEFTTVHGSCKALLARLRFPSLITTSFGPAETFCTQLSAATQAKAHDLSEEAAGRLEAHQERYTMQQESLAHRAALASMATATAAGTAMIAQPEGGEVELFDEPPAADSAPLTPNVEGAEPDTSPAADAPTDACVMMDDAAPQSPGSANDATAEDKKKPEPAAAEDLGDGIELF